MSTIIGLVSTFRLPLQGVVEWTLKRREGTPKSKKGRASGPDWTSSRPNLAKGGAEQLSGKEKPSRVY